ncbi:hypothetical protein HELRODRAFT_176613 [Helobdella robusta]|uniref:Polycystin domain-containing protein n=1 Tax=Helobdella robusta TaxID=6412 RepID=T1FAQ6_HELRO|nr:hypothetical protein HELRODRAFT_176613 [Helobdella robusta]ESN99848.1 hypothetical protein HELRODRAFT_176613 [Helobdella robusta]
MVVFMSFIHSSIFKTRLFNPVYHIGQIKFETLENLKTMTTKEKLRVRFLRKTELYNPVKWSEAFQDKLIKRLEWDGGYKQFSIESAFYIFLVIVFLSLSIMLYTGEPVLVTVRYEKLLVDKSVNKTKLSRFWEWMEVVVNNTYSENNEFYFHDKYDSSPVLLKPLCMHLIKHIPDKKTITWNALSDSYGFFDNTTVCLSFNKQVALAAIRYLKYNSYFDSSHAAIVASVYLHAFHNDLLTNLLMYFEITPSGMTKMKMKVTNVELFQDTDDNFLFISFIFFLCALFSTAHVIQRMAVFGFGNFGMAGLWFVFLKQWQASRLRIIHRFDFNFEEFSQMHALSTFPAALLLMLYSWRVFYYSCVNDSMNVFFFIIGRSLRTCTAFFLAYTIVVAGLLCVTNILATIDMPFLRLLAKGMVLFASDCTFQLGQTSSHQATSVITLRALIFATLMLYKLFSISVVTHHAVMLHVYPVESSVNRWYLMFMIARIMRKEEKFVQVRQTYINMSIQKSKIKWFKIKQKKN